jgi:hypothetical protein
MLPSQTPNRRRLATFCARSKRWIGRRALSAPDLCRSVLAIAGTRVAERSVHEDPRLVPELKIERYDGLTDVPSEAHSTLVRSAACLEIDAAIGVRDAHCHVR